MARLDVHLASAGLAESRERAQALILAGKVRVGGETVRRPGRAVKEGEDVSVEAGPGFVACEALKPPGKRFKGMNIYDVVASLIGKRKAARLRELTIHPQDVRSGYVHRGELAAGELVPMFLFDEFADPSFDGMLQELYEACRICLIEWLRCAGQYEVVWLTRPGSADSQQDP